MPILGDLFLQVILYIYNTIGFHSLGVAIIEISIISRLIFYPFIKQQTNYSRKMSELQPHLTELKEKHKGNQQAFATAQMALFKEHGVNPAAGCLPAVVQIVVLFGLLGAMNAIINCNVDITKCSSAIIPKHMNTVFFYWNLIRANTFKVSGLPFPIPGVLVVIAAATQFIQTKMMMPPKAVPLPTKVVAKKVEEKKSDFMAEFADAQSSMVWMFPLIFLFLGTRWPSGLALYWSTSSLIAIVQQYRISGLGSLQQDVVKLKALINKTR